MSVEPIATVIKEWETERLTTEQAIGKLFLLMQQQQVETVRLQKRIIKLENRLPQLETDRLNGRY